jgi:hypothetical protein
LIRSIRTHVIVKEQIFHYTADNVGFDTVDSAASSCGFTTRVVEKNDGRLMTSNWILL